MVPGRMYLERKPGENGRVQIRPLGTQSGPQQQAAAESERTGFALPTLLKLAARTGIKQSVAKKLPSTQGSRPSRDKSNHSLQKRYFAMAVSHSSYTLQLICRAFSQNGILLQRGRLGLLA